MYPAGAVTWVTVEGLSSKLDGRSRPGHFRGVTTVVAKLFHIVEPDAAFFGQKDAAQVAIIRRMVRDLNFPVEIVACPIVREPDGLAMSSRNAYLDPQQRKQALVLHRSLLRVKKSWEAGERDAEKSGWPLGCEEIAAEKSVRLDYLEIVDPDSLESLRTAAAATARWSRSPRSWARHGSSTTFCCPNSIHPEFLCPPERSEGSWFLPARPGSMLRANTKIPQLLLGMTNCLGPRFI